MAGCQFRFHPQLKALRESLQIDRIGSPVKALPEWGSIFPIGIYAFIDAGARVAIVDQDLGLAQSALRDAVRRA